jgi:exodeoxyribonuclease-3
MKVATWNINSILARLPHVLRWITAERPDVLCLQELKCADDRFPTSEFTALGYNVAVYGQPSYNGVAILSRAPLEDVQRGMPDDVAGAQTRVITATVEGVRLVNVYIPNGSLVGSEKYDFKLGWMARLRSFLDENFWADDEVLLCGDFNVAPEDIDVHDPVLWRGKIHCSELEREALDNVKSWGFVDTFRSRVKDGGHFSWWDYRAGSFRRNAGLRIDHIWTSEPLAERCQSIWIHRDPRAWERPSDHAPVIAEFL